MTPDIEKIEHLLNAKSFAELNAAERELVMGHLSGAAEYEHMRETLLRVKKVFVAEAAALQSDAELKEQILNRFEQNKPVARNPLERIGQFFQTLFPSPAGRFAGSLVLLVAVITVSFLLWPRDQQSEMAMQLLPPATEPQIITLVDHSPPTVSDELRMDGIATLETREPLNQGMVATGAGSVSAPGDVSYDLSVPDASADKEFEIRTAVTEDLKAMPAEPDRAHKIAEEQTPAVYRNNEGLLQYNNTRMAESSTWKASTEGTDAYKDYSRKAKKNEDQNAQKPVPAGQPQKSDGRAEADNAYEKTQNGLYDEVKTQTVLEESKVVVANGKTIALQGPIPAWPGVEARPEPFRTTQESVRAFFEKELAATDNPDRERTDGTQYVKLVLSFNAQGVITKVHVSGQVSEAQKKALIRRALQLPTFKFTAAPGQPVLEQTYLLEIR